MKGSAGVNRCDQHALDHQEDASNRPNGKKPDGDHGFVGAPRFPRLNNPGKEEQGPAGQADKLVRYIRYEPVEFGHAIYP